MTSVATLTLALFAAAVAGAQTPPAMCPLSGGGVGDGPPPTFERVVDGATAIVEATVQSVVRDPQPTGPGDPIPREHAVLRAVRVLKGPDSLGLFTAWQTRASGHFALQPDQRLLLFLNPPGSGPASPERPDLPAHAFAAGGRAILCIDGGKVWVSRSSGAPLRERFDGVEVEKAVADIQSHVKLRRVAGRVVVEGGPLPVADFLFDVPGLEVRNRPRIVLKPVDDRGGQRREVVAIVSPALSPSTPAAALPPASVTVATINRTGSGTIPLDEGSYQVTVEGLPFGYHVKSLMYGARDVSREPLRPQNPSPELLVTLTQKPPDGKPAGVRVSGRVTGPLDRLRLWVVMIAGDGTNSRVGAVQPSPDGGYEFVNVPPGKYTLKVANSGVIPFGVTWSPPPPRPVDVGNRDVQIE